MPGFELDFAIPIKQTTDMQQAITDLTNAVKTLNINLENPTPASP